MFIEQENCSEANSDHHTYFRDSNVQSPQFSHSTPAKEYQIIDHIKFISDYEIAYMCRLS